MGRHWQTFLVGQDPGGGPLLTLEESTRYPRPHSPASAEVTFPGAPGPARVAHARGGITVTAHDGTVTALLLHSSEKLRGADIARVPPPGGWPHLKPVDPDGSAVLPETGRAQAERLLDAAFTGPRAAAEAVDPLITSGPLREAVAETAVTAAGCLFRLVSLRAALGREPQPALPPVLRTRPDLPVGRSVGLLPALRRLAGLVEDAAARPLREGPHPIGISEDLATHLPVGCRTRRWTRRRPR